MPFSSSSLRNGDASVESVAVCLGIRSLLGLLSLFPLPLSNS